MYQKEATDVNSVSVCWLNQHLYLLAGSFECRPNLVVREGRYVLSLYLENSIPDAARRQDREDG